jgi:hypothetical protein
VLHRYRRQGEDAALEDSARLERRGTAHLPENVAGIGIAGEQDRGADIGREGRADLEDEHRVRMALAVQDQRAPDLQRSRGVVDARVERLACANDGDIAQQVGRALGRSGVVCGREIRLSVGCQHRGYLLAAVHHDARREPGHRATRAQAEVAADNAQTSVGDRGRSQDGERGRITEADWYVRSACLGLRGDEEGRDADGGSKSG